MQQFNLWSKQKNNYKKNFGFSTELNMPFQIWFHLQNTYIYLLEKHHI